jgi:hypothetical protein
MRNRSQGIEAFVTINKKDACRLERMNPADLQALSTRIIHESSTAAAEPGMSTVLRSFGLLDVLSSTSRSPKKLTYLHLA